MEISANTAAVMAYQVYQLNEPFLPDRLVARINLEIGGGLELPTSSLIGSYGIGAAKVQSHGGLFILGKDKYKGDAFIVFRGTQLSVDWGTNIDIATRSTGTGRVHVGFYKAMCSMQDQIRQFVVQAQRAGVVRFHCIGHSLGGAIATLCADWLKAAFKITPYVYTFGAARPGLGNFAKKFSLNFSQDRIFRVYHTGDIVPYIAPWPFAHAPDSKKSGRIVAGGNVPNAEWHSMTKYIDSVKGKSWDVLITPTERSFSAMEIERWLLSDKDSTGNTMSLTFIEKISAAIKHLMVNVLKVALGALTLSASSAFTWYDFVAYLFKKQLRRVGRVADLVLGLLNKLLRAMGLTVIADAGQLTRDKIRHAFLTFNARLNHLAYKAVNNTLAGGKAI
jgi:triacylglycerol lipase